MLYESVDDMIWNLAILKSMTRHYQRHFNCDREVALDYVKNNCRGAMLKYYEKLYLPEVNLDLEYITEVN